MYTVIFRQMGVTNPYEVQAWLNECYEKDSLELVACSGEYFIFKDRPIVKAKDEIEG